MSKVMEKSVEKMRDKMEAGFVGVLLGVVTNRTSQTVHQDHQGVPRYVSNLRFLDARLRA